MDTVTLQTEKAERPGKAPPGMPANPFRALLLLLVALAVYFGGADFWKRFYDDPALDKSEVRAAEENADEIAERHELWIQYVLIADHTMKRPCLRCPGGVKMVTVKTGEIYKYGITTQGKARYAAEHYKKLGVTFFEEYRGSYEACKRMEINKIIAYRFLPQSLKLEVKLLRPPGNANKS